MMPRLKVSVIISTYNYGRYIEKAVKSVLEQDFPQDQVEVIVVDDGSTDDTSSKLAPYMGRIIYIHKTNGGQASAINAGFDIAKGEIIALLDSDDFWYPNKLAAVVREFEGSGNIDVVYNYMHIVDSNGSIIGEIKETNAGVCFEKGPLSRLLAGLTIFAPQTSEITVRAACLKNIMPIPEKINICADSYINMLLPLYAREYAMCGQWLGAYYLHLDNYWAHTVRTAMLTRKDIDITEIIKDNLVTHVRRCGYNVSAVERMFKAIIAEKVIILHKLDGKLMEALKEAFIWRGFSSNSCKARDGIIKKAHLILYVLLPYRVYRFLYSIYENNFLSRIKRRIASSKQ